MDLNGRRAQSKDSGARAARISLQIDCDIDFHRAQFRRDMRIALGAHVEEAVEFISTPEGAKVSLGNHFLVFTPGNAVLPKQTESHIIISKAGFKPADVYVHIDGGSLAPNPVEVKLRLELLPEKPGADNSKVICDWLGHSRPELERWTREQVV